MNEGARSWLLRLLALGIAVSLWFGVSFEEREELSERLVEASVSYNRPRGFVILDQVQSVNVRLRGSRRLIRQLNPFMVDVQVELAQTQPGTVTLNLGPENVLAPDGLEVVSIEPNSIRVELEREIAQRLRVVPQIVGKPANGWIADEPEVFPNLVLVSGPESLVGQGQPLSTRPINLTGRTAAFEESVAVIPPDPLIQVVQPSKVTVRVPLHPPVADDEPETRNPEP
ncbi:MAG TPA: CdaR family protein [Thermoanaerobaculia bacterium]